MFKDKNIKEYCIVVKKRSWELSEDVNGLIKEGWQPYGNLIRDRFDLDGQHWLFQPMVKLGK